MEKLTKMDNFYSESYFLYLFFILCVCGFLYLHAYLVSRKIKKSILHFSGTSVMSDSKSSFEFLELNPGPQ